MTLLLSFGIVLLDAVFIYKFIILMFEYSHASHFSLHSPSSSSLSSPDGTLRGNEGRGIAALGVIETVGKRNIIRMRVRIQSSHKHDKNIKLTVRFNAILLVWYCISWPVFKKREGKKLNEHKLFMFHRVYFKKSHFFPPNALTHHSLASPVLLRFKKISYLFLVSFFIPCCNNKTLTIIVFSDTKEAARLLKGGGKKWRDH